MGRRGGRLETWQVSLFHQHVSLVISPAFIDFDILERGGCSLPLSDTLPKSKILDGLSVI